MFKNQKIRFRILLGYSVPIILFLVASVIVLVNVISLANLHNNTERTNNCLLQIKEVSLSLAKMQRSARGFLLEKNDISRNAYDVGKTQLEAAFEALQTLVIDEKQKERLNKIKQLSKKIIDFNDNIISFVENGDTAKALEIFKSAVSLDFAKEIDFFSKEIDNAEREIFDKNRITEEASMETIKVILLIGTLLSVLLSITIGLFIASGITKHISTAVTAMSSTSNEIAATVNQHERTASQQASMVNETTTTIQELSASANKTSEQATFSTEAAQNSLNATSEGEGIVKQAIDGICDLGEKVGMVADQILKLGEQTAQLGNLANMVKDLSGEINMLALNAAVEAARAGEHGKGFAVVAGEIRKLANESKKSAEQSNAVISEIQKATNATILRTEEGTKVVEQVTGYTRDLGKLFNTLSESADIVYENAQQLLLNAKQQATAIGQIVEAMNSLNTGAKDTAAGITQTKTGIEQLNNAAVNLKQIL